MRDFANTFTFEGQFQHGMKNGPGKWIDLLSQDEYSGEFVDDQKHGKGELFNKKNNLLIEGLWKEGELVETISCKLVPK
jgi:hypothetical protein